MNIRAHHSSHSSTRAGLAAAAIAATVLVGTAACTGSSTAGTASAGTSATASSSSGPGGAGTVSLPAASAPAATSAPETSVPATSAPVTSGATTDAGSGANTAAAGRTPSCGNADIAVSLGRAGVAMNHEGQAVVFKNVGPHACRLQGNPGAAVVGGGKTLVDATRALNGYIGDMRQLSSAPVVTLQPGQSASAEVEWLGDAGEKCYAKGSGNLVVTPPNTTKSTSLLPVTVGSVGGMCAQFEVHPVVAGIITG